MRDNKIKKQIIGFLILAEILILPFSALAQAVPTCDPNTGSSCPAGYIAGIAANTGLQAAIVTASTTNLVCETAEQKYFNAATVKQLGFSGLSIIGGSGVQLAQYSADLLAIDGPPGDSTIPPLGFIPCRKFVLSLLDKVIASNVFISNQKQTIYNSATAALANLKAREESIKAKQANASQGFWKTLVFNILIKTSKAVANSLVGKLVSSYKINNIKQYTDSVATLMYDNQFLRDNFPKEQDQFMARAILENPSFRNQVAPGFFVAADAALGFDPKALDPNDPQYYTKMASVGSTYANPYFQHSDFVGGVDQSHAAALAYAQNHIAQGNGYKAPVTCAGSLAQQQAIDGKTKAASDQLANRQALVNNLTQAQTLGTNLSDAQKATLASDLAKAQADLAAAQSSWNNLPYAVTGANSGTGTSSLLSNLTSGTNTEGTAAIIMCEAISSPAILVNQGIDAVFKSVGVKMGQYDSNNLPGFINIIGDVASQIGSSLILGGGGAAKGALMINEGKIVSGAVAVASDAAAAADAAKLATNGITFSVDPDTSGNYQSYDISWYINTDVITNASFVTFQGDGISPIKTDPVTKQVVPNKFGLNNSDVAAPAIPIKVTVGGSYTINVFDANGRIIVSGTTTIPAPVKPSTLSYNNSGPRVAGAFTQREQLDVRGPAVVIAPRGN